jgi:hypothetical protein
MIDDEYVYLQVFRTFAKYISSYDDFIDCKHYINSNDFVDRLFPQKDYERFISNIIFLKTNLGNQEDVKLSSINHDKYFVENCFSDFNKSKYNYLFNKRQIYILKNKQLLLKEVLKKNFNIFDIKQSNDVFDDMKKNITMQLNYFFDLNPFRYSLIGHPNMLRKKLNSMYENIKNRNFNTNYLIYEVDTCILFYLIVRIRRFGFLNRYISYYIITNSKGNFLIIQSDSKRCIDFLRKLEKNRLQEYVTNKIFENRENIIIDSTEIDKPNYRFSLNSLLNGERYSPLVAYVEPLFKII